MSYFHERRKEIIASVPPHRNGRYGERKYKVRRDSRAFLHDHEASLERERREAVARAAAHRLQRVLFG